MRAGAGGARRVAVELDPEPRPGARQQRAVGDLGGAGEERGAVARRERELADPEVRAGQVELAGGGGGYLAERIVGGHQHMVRLTPAGNLAQLGKAAGDADVRAAVVDQVTVE